MKLKHYLLISLLILGFVLTAQAQYPHIISYQGMLYGTNEQPVEERNYKMVFTIYDEPENGNALWTETFNEVLVAGGQFSVYLGGTNPIELPFDHPYFLGIKVENEPELQPRSFLAATPFSLKASDANTIAGIPASDVPQQGFLFPLGVNGKFPSDVLPSSSVSGNFLKKHEPDTSRGTYTAPMILVVNKGDGDAITGRNIGGTGRGVVARSDANDGVVGWSGCSDKSGVFGHSDNGFGVTGRSDNNYAVFGASKTSFGGFFRSDNDHLDLALGGPVGRINTDPDLPNSNLILSSNNDVTIRLDNNGGGNGIFEIKNSGGNNVCTVNEEGDMALFCEGTKIIELGKGLDYAEGFDVSGENKISAGTVVIIDSDNPGKLAVSNKQYDNKVAGIVAGANGLGSGVRLGAGLFDCDVALAGRVYCKVDASYGEVTPGALLTTSATPGYAMVVKDFSKAHGAILGKAMEKLPQGTKGQILVLVTLQ